MARTPEGVVKDDIKKFLDQFGVRMAGRPEIEGGRGWMYMPVPTPFGVNGIPDFCGILFGAPFYIEAKAPKDGRPSENQLNRHAEIRAAGGHIVVATCALHVEAYIAATWPEKYADFKEAQKAAAKK